MNVLALIDHSVHATAVLDHAAWASARLDAPVEVVHAIDWQPHPMTVDRSGRLGVDASETLLEELAVLDQDRHRLMREGGRALLDDAAARLRVAGVHVVRQRLIHGDLVEHLQDVARETWLVVMGWHGETGRSHPGRMLERVIRGTHRPVLVVAGPRPSMKRFVFAYDGGRSAGEAIHWLVDTRFLVGLSGHLFQVGEGTSHERERLASATWHLWSSGMDISDEVRNGDPVPTIVATVAARQADLLVMGAYGHARIRRMMVDSTTTELLHDAPGAMLVFH